jgi:hypothetical protein
VRIERERAFSLQSAAMLQQALFVVLEPVGVLLGEIRKVLVPDQRRGSNLQRPDPKVRLAFLFLHDIVRGTCSSRSICRL